ncbi:MAG: PEGA domain-containing protein, partial [Proteobacteria bacterium]|nr:PEGA domain-containing protein [Pseudomonadota bacterium]
LTVAPTPNDAQVRVLNVDSGYEPGMELEPGRYQLEVSREGYETSTQWVELGTEPLDVKVALKEVPKVVVPEAPAVPAAKPAPAQPAAPTSAVQMVYPGSAKYAPLNFEHHARHLALEQGCTACHHKWDKASPITGCRVSGCHADTSDKKAPTGYNMAFHSTAPNSCLGCHKKVKGTAPIKCSGCHTRK